MKELVFKVYWGGLGDHLLYSPIPRLAKEIHGYDKVYISNHSNYRNPNTKQLVWGYNPYIDGFSDKDTDYPKFSETDPGLNILDQIALFVGISDEATCHLEPEIYYKPKIIPELKNAILFDPNSINKSGVPTIADVENYFNRKNIQITHQMKGLYGNINTRGRTEVHSETLEQFCDMIVSCKEFICFTTGAATLAAALGKSANVLYISGIKPMFHHSRQHTYTNIDWYTC